MCGVGHALGLQLVGVIPLTGSFLGWEVGWTNKHPGAEAVGGCSCLPCVPEECTLGLTPLPDPISPGSREQCRGQLGKNLQGVCQEVLPSSFGAHSVPMVHPLSVSARSSAFLSALCGPKTHSFSVPTSLPPFSPYLGFHPHH